jgi:hypothetical protein
MQKSKSRALVAALTVAGIVAGSFSVIGAAEAKSAKCVATPVPGAVATFIVTCSTHRP